MNNPYRGTLIAGTILATLLAAESCHAFKTGTLKQMCATPQTDLACMSYIRGVADGVATAQARSHDKRICFTGTAADTIDSTRRVLAGADLDNDTTAGSAVTAILQVIHPCATI